MDTWKAALFFWPKHLSRANRLPPRQAQNIGVQKTATIIENYKCASGRPFHFCLAERNAKISIDDTLKFLFADTFS